MVRVEKYYEQSVKRDQFLVQQDCQQIMPGNVNKARPSLPVSLSRLCSYCIKLTCCRLSTLVPHLPDRAS